MTTSLLTGMAIYCAIEAPQCRSQHQTLSRPRNFRSRESESVLTVTKIGYASTGTGRKREKVGIPAECLQNDAYQPVAI